MTVNLITRRVRTNGAQVMAKCQRADASMFLTSKKKQSNPDEAHFYLTSLIYLTTSYRMFRTKKYGRRAEC